ncbi:hypothetical protein YYC_02828 [Plasmodium yoelii 17X]|uniref:Uncharacterized protein n=1 Tax=Plasmodium yoelii 17X TaxID=1323249 RepID=V7PIP3_PLAYE|nr:hypothetical protein YYC_02828 [Plasmodium yoelii 17X]
MNDHVCRKFLLVRNWFPDKLNNAGNYYFNGDNIFKEYCTSNSCDSDLEKLNAGCLFLFDVFFKDFSVFKNHNNIDIVYYIIIWLSYMLNLKKNVEGITNIQHFYGTSINSDNRYKTTITGIPGYDNYKDLIDKKTDLKNMDMNKNIISKLYDAFKLLCDMYTNFHESTLHCSNCFENAKNFAEKYKEMNQNSDITSNDYYKQLLYTLSNDYNNFKKYCNSKGGKCEEYPTLSTIEKIQSYRHISEDTSSSSSITNKLFIVLSIFGAIAFFFGISYKVNNKELKKKLLYICKH